MDAMMHEWRQSDRQYHAGGQSNERPRTFLNVYT